MFNRALNLPDLLNKRSHFLFGPRATGKSTLIAETLKDALIFDLLNPEVFRRLLRSPKLIGEQVKEGQIVVIDEIQKMPNLLDEVHRLIFSKKQKFLLTGSSARKLKRGSANLLAGRAFNADLFPLTYAEIPGFNLLCYLNSTGLPEFYNHPDAKEFLKAYVGTYLQEEIQAEALTRDLPGFSSFLEAAALSNGEEINYAGLSSDTGVQAKTLKNYYQILEDTLLGFTVPAFQKTIKRKPITRSKHYLFDIGVVNLLTRRGQIESGSELFGRAFEHFIAMELRAWLSYKRIDLPLSYWRSTSQFEVDFIIGDELAIEVKSTDLVTDKHLKGLRALKEEGLIKQYVIVSHDSDYRLTNDGIHILPWQFFLDNLSNANFAEQLANWRS